MRGTKYVPSREVELNAPACKVLERKIQMLQQDSGLGDYPKWESIADRVLDKRRAGRNPTEYEIAELEKAFRELGVSLNPSV